MEDVGVGRSQAGFAALHRANEMPDDVAGCSQRVFNRRPLGGQLLRPVLAEVAHPGLIGGDDQLGRPGLGDGDQGHIGDGPAAALGRRSHACQHFLMPPAQLIYV